MRREASWEEGKKDFLKNTETRHFFVIKLHRTWYMVSLFLSVVSHPFN